MIAIDKIVPQLGFPYLMALVAALSLQTASGLAAEQHAFRLGVQTHFSQGWGLNRMAKISDAGAETFRDGLRWDMIEYAPGQYYFGSIAPQMSRAGRFGLEPLLVFHGVHPRYDGEQTPYTSEGRRAFAEFVAATISAFPDQIKQVEIGNEINAPNFMVGPFEEDPEGNYAALVAEVSGVLRDAHPEVKILCTGAHSIALGYFRRLFEAGALDSCDAISLHPYRPTPEGVDREITQLREIMNEYGEAKPIYATEFGSWFEDPAEAPDFMLKMVTLMAHSGVDEAYWYALYDESWWPNMGLFDIESRDKPAAGAFRFIVDQLLPLGRPTQVAQSSVDKVFAFGPDGRGLVAWGPDAQVKVMGDATFHDSSGNEISPPLRLGDKPIVILGENISLEIVRDAPAYDSLYQFQSAPWSYHAAADDGPEAELELQETNWGPYLGNRYLKPLSISDLHINGSLFEGAPMRAIERFTAPTSGTYEISGDWTPTKAEGDGADLRITRGTDVLASAVILDGEFQFGPVTVTLEAGETVDFSVGPNQEPGGDVLERRIRIAGPLK